MNKKEIDDLILRMGFGPYKVGKKCNDGVCICFDEKWQIKEAVKYKNGLQVGWRIRVNCREQSGVAEPVEGDLPDTEVYESGISERYNPWSDSVPGIKCDFNAWLIKWIEHIYKNA